MKLKNKTRVCSKNVFPPFQKNTFANPSIENPNVAIQAEKIEVIDTNNLQYAELCNLAQKKKWMDRYRKAYRGTLLPETDVEYEETSKYVVASADNKEIGFLRLSNCSKYFCEVTDEQVWDISDGYVKPAYQSQGVLRKMIMNAVENYHAKSLTIAYERYAANASYYALLGFTVIGDLADARCLRLYVSDWETNLAKVCSRIEI